MEARKFDAIILGAGAAGLSAGIYLSRGKSTVLILDMAMPGGQMVLTHQVANYPGVELTSGYQLSATMKKQAESFGCEIQSNVRITRLNLEEDTKEVVVNDTTTYQSKVLILASGGRSRMLHVPGENELKGRGVSYCATCDGDFFQDKEIVVVGGGNSALEEAVSLTKYASKVTILHEFDYFQAFDHAVDEARSNPKIHFLMASRITEFRGSDKLEGIVYKDLKSGLTHEMSADGTFIFIGYEPNTEFIQETGIQLNQKNEIVTDDQMQTNVAGVFAAGDSRAKRYRQITTAVADGSIAAMAALEYIHKLS